MTEVKFTVFDIKKACQYGYETTYWLNRRLSLKALRADLKIKAASLVMGLGMDSGA